MMKRYRKEAGYYVLVLLGVSVVLWWMYHVMSFDLPLRYDGGDSTFLYSMARTMQHDGWVLQNTQLGMPFQSDLYLWPSNLLYNFDLLFLKLFVTVTGNPVLAGNLECLVLYPLIACTSFFALRQMEIRPVIAGMGALLYCFSPYVIARNISHIVLAECEFIPLVFLMCYWIYQEPEYFCPGKGFFHSKKNILTILFCILIANNGIAYYPFFGCFFLLAAAVMRLAREKNGRAFMGHCMTAALIVGFFVLNFLPLIWMSIGNGASMESAVRGARDAETYALKISQMYVPTNAHGIPILQSIVDVFNNASVTVNENRSAYLGLLQAAGFTALIAFVFAPQLAPADKTGDKESWSLFSRLALAAVLLATLGGYSQLFAVFITGMIRCYNRISIFIAFLAVIALVRLTQYWYEHSKKRQIVLVICAVLFAAGLWEQIPYLGTNRAIEEEYRNDEMFVRQIEASVSPEAMIYSLPWQEYPEGAKRNQMESYQLLNPYFHSTGLRWSYGAVKGSAAHVWNSRVAVLDWETRMEVLSAVGFEGIYMDRRAYTPEEWEALNAELSAVLNTEPMTSQNGILAFYDMAQYNEQYRSLYTDEEWETLRQSMLNVGMLK